ncbi:hypothetical protein [Luedemannella helvata]|uniref:Uncharacterized protein n=1 Tax=Luedemannella helvata TaxID=349315 RepID=A0ABP4WS99_9ACTN
MTAKRQLLRVTAVAVAVMTGVGTAVVTAAPAWAISPRIDVTMQVSSPIVAGGEGREVQTRIRNETRRLMYVDVRRALYIQLRGVQPQHVRVSINGGGARAAEALGNGTLRIPIDQNGKTLRPRGADNGQDELSLGLTLRFTSDAPAGRATVRLGVTAAGFNDPAFSRAHALTVRAGAAPSPSRSPSPKPTTEAPPTSELPVETATDVLPGGGEAGQPTAAATANNSGSGVPWPMYLLGTLLIVGGGILIWWLLRGGKPEEDAPAPALAGGGHTAVLPAATQVIPQPRSAYPPATYGAPPPPPPHPLVQPSPLVGGMGQPNPAPPPRGYGPPAEPGGPGLVPGAPHRPVPPPQQPTAPLPRIEDGRHRAD